ncbi:MAG: SPOR domain-containing protein [Candidatus Cryptobacteroides sp.]
MGHFNKISIAMMAAVAAALLFPAWSGAQNTVKETDSLVFRQSAALDSALVGKSIYNILNGGHYGSGEVKIHQSQAITDAMRRHIERNPSRTLSGYRVRIFFDNSQNARNASEQVVRKFSASYPGVPAYRSYQNPFFKVAVGDFRTKSEAMEFLQRVKPAFPAAFIVKEPIEFPAPDRKHTFTIDTVKVVRNL